MSSRPARMRILAIDYGTKRVGLAASDETQSFASPIGYLPAAPWETFLAALRRVVEEKQVERIIVGMPRNMDGTYGPAAENVRRFAEALAQAVPLPIDTYDERLSSVMAHRLLRDAAVKGPQRKGKIDAAAAAVFLQDYLDGRAR